MDKITLVIGGSRGLGRRTATAIARQAGDVVVTDRDAADEA